MKSLRLLFALIALSMLQPGCKPETPAVVTPAVEIPEKSKRDVTICVVPGPMPDVMQTHVKADGKQRVCWKGHGQAYEIYFKTADWPFEEEAPLAPDADYRGLRAPADSAGDFFTLKSRLSSGQTEVHPYEIREIEREGAATPPGGGPEIIGEG